MKRILPILLILVLMAASFVYGVLVYRSKIFPYNLLKQLNPKPTPTATRLPPPPPTPPPDSENGWSIGIYTGPSPFQLSAPAGIKNPVLMGKDVTDVPASAVADPFLVVTDKSYTMFMEVYNKSSGHGDIGLAESANGSDWKYRQVVIDEPFHLSYPYVFQWQNEYYMVPESNADLSVRIYRATDFPTQWKYEKNLLAGYHFVDASLVRYRDLWWLFVSMRENDALNLYYSSDLMGPYTQHPLSPVVKNNPHTSRPAGRMLVLDDRLYRFAQDDFPEYGSQVFAFEILELSPTSYREKPVSDEPVLKPVPSNWNMERMHHIDAHLLPGGGWLAAVDGYLK